MTLTPADDSIRLVPASQFTIEQLTVLYNKTRVDYMVPMPMNVARLADYVRLYDVNLDRSFVAMQGEEMLGVAMLGIRHQRAWITRLGVVPTTRRHGAGKMLVAALVDAVDSLHLPLIMLEVIKNNAPAHQLF